MVTCWEGNCFCETLQIPENSRFWSGKRFLQSGYSEGLRDIETNRLKNKNKVTEGKEVFTFQLYQCRQHHELSFYLFAHGSSRSGKSLVSYAAGTSITQSVPLLKINSILAEMVLI